MGDFSTVVVVAAVMTGAYFIYARRAMGQTIATALALLVFLLLIAVMVCRRVV